MNVQYYGETIARSIMFSNNIDKLLKKIGEILPKINVNQAELLGIINETFLAYGSTGFISAQGKSNIYMFLYYISRNVELDDEARAIYMSYYSEIINMLNNSVTNKKKNEFYRMELSIRKNAKKYYNPDAVSDKKIEERETEINKSIESDLNVLFSHLSLPDQDFMKQQINFVVSPTFVESSRYLVNEFPSLISEKTFKRRLCSTLESKEFYSKRYRKNIIRRLTLDQEKTYLGQIKYTKDDKKLYKKVAGI